MMGFLRPRIGLTAQAPLVPRQLAHDSASLRWSVDADQPSNVAAARTGDRAVSPGFG
jgi:hypothetical protein